MPIAVKISISKPKSETFKVSAVDSESLIEALDKLKSWGSYAANPSALVKVGKDKKVSEVVIKAKPVSTLPVWPQYSKTTKNRKADWDKMIPCLKKYLTNQHALFLEAVAMFSKELKSLSLTKPEFEKRWKAKTAEFVKIHNDYAQKTSNGSTLGVKLELIGPDPVEGKSNVKTPKSKKYTVSGKTVKAVYEALKKRSFWGRYRSHQSASMEFAIDGKLSKITIKAAPTITIPKWSEYSKGNKAQKATWDSMWTALNAHELHHHKIFTDEVKTFLKNIKDMELTKAEATSHWDDNNKDWQDLQDAFDGRSDHGANDGVSLDFGADP